MDLSAMDSLTTLYCLLVFVSVEGWTCNALDLSSTCENVAAIGCTSTRINSVLTENTTTETCSNFHALENCYIYKGCSGLEARQLITQHCGDRCEDCLQNTEVSVNAVCLMESSSSCKQSEISLHRAIIHKKVQVCGEFKKLYNCFLTSGCLSDVVSEVLEELCGGNCDGCSNGQMETSSSLGITLCILATILFWETFRN